MKILVCGPRNLDASAMPAMSAAMRRVLLAHHPFAPGFVLAHGAARGADFLWEDALVELTATEPRLWMPIRRMPARWATEGRAAGPLRNQRMLEAVRPTYWLAAHWETEPSTPGTSDMVRRLRAAGVPGEVVLVPEPEARKERGRATSAAAER